MLFELQNYYVFFYAVYDNYVCGTKTAFFALCEIQTRTMLQVWNETVFFPSSSNHK